VGALRRLRPVPSLKGAWSRFMLANAARDAQMTEHPSREINAQRICVTSDLARHLYETSPTPQPTANENPVPPRPEHCRRIGVVPLSSPVGYPTAHACLAPESQNRPIGRRTRPPDAAVVTIQGRDQLTVRVSHTLPAWSSGPPPKPEPSRRARMRAFSPNRSAVRMRATAPVRPVPQPHSVVLPSRRHDDPIGRERHGLHLTS